MSTLTRSSTEIAFVATHLDEVHGPTLALAAGVLVLLLVGSQLFPRAPMPLIGMLAAAVVVAVFDLETHGIAVVGDIPAGPADAVAARRHRSSDVAVAAAARGRAWRSSPTPTTS